MTSDAGSDTGSEMDEETGLTKREGRQRRRQQDQLDVRIGEHVPVTKHDARLADRDVIRKLLINSVLILLWYFFSLAISIVSTTAIVRCPETLLTNFIVQQMDVRPQTPQLSLPALHVLPSYAHPILPLSPRPLLRHITTPVTHLTTILASTSGSTFSQQPRLR